MASGMNWGDPVPERIPDWTAFDIAVMLIAVVVMAAIGVLAAGGPS